MNAGVSRARHDEYNLAERKHRDVLEHCQRLGIVFFAYYPLKLGDYQAQVNALSRKYTATPAQIALAWLLQQADVMVPIPGTLSLQHLTENLAATKLVLDPADLERLNAGL
jgi:pyridoxine 4-dehydrogenase